MIGAFVRFVRQMGRAFKTSTDVVGMAKGLSIVLTVMAMALGGAAAGAQWQLATDDTRIELQIADGRLVMERLEHTGGGHNWAGEPMPVALMAKVWVGRREMQTQWTFAGSSRSRRAGTLALEFTNADPKLTLRSIWRAQHGPGPIEHWIEIANQSDAPVTVSHQDSLSLVGLQPGAPAEASWIQRGGGNASTQGGTHSDPITPGMDLVLTSNCEDGASPVPWMALQVGEERGLYVGWEFSGLGRVQLKAGESGGSLDLCVGLNPDFKTDVRPGETFVVPPAFVGCYVGDLDEGSYRLHRFIIDKLRPKLPRGFADPTLAYNVYLDAGSTNAKEADVLRSAAACHDLGFETFMPDAMWFPACGDWRWDPARFPNGIRPIEEYVHGHGMKMALWCAWTNGGVSEHADALSVRGPVGHPDWFGADYAPDWQPGPFYGGQLCLGCEEAKEWAIAKTQWLVGEHKLDYLKHDCGPIVTSCNKTTHRHSHGVDASYWAATGYYEVQEKLRKAFPHLILENCSGGGHIKDFGVIARTHYTVTTDTLSNLPNRQSIYDSTFAFPPILLQGYTYENFYDAKGDNPGPYFWRSAMMGAWQIDPTNVASWTEPERESVRKAVRIYKEWIRPMLQDVKVYHILPRPDGAHWDGMFYWSPSLRKGTVYIFRPDSDEEHRVIRLKGLEPASSYRIRSEDGSVEAGVRSGASLMDEGLRIALPARYTSDLIYIQEE
jgi:alpha-galactosidase